MPGQGERGATKTVRYCLVPAALAGELHEPLRRHFREHAPDVEVVVQRRATERRAGGGRRSKPTEAFSTDRRQIRNAEGRRVGERRAAAVGVDAPPLPRRARRHAERLVFVERIEPSTEAAEDLDTARLVTRIQGGSRDEFAELYMRYFERVYGYLRVFLKDSHAAEDVTQQVFVQLLDRLHSYERRTQPFRAWLFVVVRNCARDYIEREHKMSPTDPAELRRQIDRPDAEEAEMRALSWVTDRDLLFLIERLPAAQRRVLALRYMLDMSIQEIAEVTGTTPNHVSVLHYRATNFLRDRLTALGAIPERPCRRGMARRLRKAPVLRLRRFALH